MHFRANFNQISAMLTGVGSSVLDVATLSSSRMATLSDTISGIGAISRLIEGLTPKELHIPNLFENPHLLKLVASLKDTPFTAYHSDAIGGLRRSFSNLTLPFQGRTLIELSSRSKMR